MAFSGGYVGRIEVPNYSSGSLKEFGIDLEIPSTVELFEAQNCRNAHLMFWGFRNV